MTSSNNDVGAMGSSLGASVVPDLMRIYESLTQSSTPASSLPQDKQQQQQSQSSGGQSSSISNFETVATVTNEKQNQHSSHSYSTRRTVKTNITAESSSLLHPNNNNQSLPDEFLPPSTEPESSTPDQLKRNEQLTRRSIHNNTNYSSTNNSSSDVENSTTNNHQRKKKKTEDNRWSKRFAWPDELHRDFVSAVFDVGLKHASPSSILEQMPSHDDITSERIKSHLQKYRLHRQKSKKEFMGSYTNTFSKLKNGDLKMDPAHMSCGEIAAQLSFDALQDNTNNLSTAHILDSTSSTAILPISGGILHLPQLTEEEKKLPIGASLSYLMALFFSLEKQLQLQRSIMLDTTTTTMNGNSNFYSTNDTASNHNDTSFGSLPQSYYNSSDLPYIAAAGSNSNMSPEARGHQQLMYSSYNNVEMNYSSQYQRHDYTYQYSSASNGTNTTSDNREAQGSASIENNNANINNKHNLNNNNSMMKRDMKSQMAIQNKMRKLKEKELNKFNFTSTSSGSNDQQLQQQQQPQSHHQNHQQVHPQQQQQYPTSANNVATYDINIENNEKMQGVPQNDCEDDGNRNLAANNGSNNNNNNDILNTDFWDSADVDQQLFEFLMNENNLCE